MASVDEVRAGIAQANDKARESIAALQQAISSVEQAQSMMAAVTEGSSQSNADEAKALLANATRSIGEAQQSVNAAISTAEGYAQSI